MPEVLGLCTGRAVNPHVLRGQIDLENTPTTFWRHQAVQGVSDVQLLNGWGTLNFGRRMEQPAAGYLAVVNQPLPGQTRLAGTNPADFPLRGPAPSQWDYHVASSAGSQPNYPGGPGYLMGRMQSTYNGGA